MAVRVSVPVNTMRSSLKSMGLAAGVVALMLSVSCPVVQGAVVGPFPDGVPGSGYGCDIACDDGDVNYVITASLEVYTIPGVHKHEAFLGQEDVTTYVRTFTGEAGEGGEFCGGNNGTQGPLAPCLTVEPGKIMKIKLVNELDEGMEKFGQNMDYMEEYWTNFPGAPDLDNVTFDYTNLHLHGVQVYPHLFFPEGTGNPDAPWIETTPASVDPSRKCFCYVFELPPDHPQGTFLWHIHRHSATAMQGWQGMAGFLYIGGPDSPGSPENDLAKYNVTRELPIALWEWDIDLNETTIAAPGSYIVGDFLSDSNQDILLTNNEFQPEYSFCVNEVAHVRLLCAQTTTGSAITVLDEDDELVPFWVFASDGISYDKAYEKRVVVVGPGQRQDMLFQFTEPGTYNVMQLSFDDDLEKGFLANFGNQTAFTINVTDDCTVDPALDISTMEFTPGMGGQDIPAEDVINRITVQFEVIPPDTEGFASFRVDGQLYDISHVMKDVEAGTGQAWTLTSQREMIHPFHIHVNPFQVIEMESTWDKIIVHPSNMTLVDAIKETNLVPPNQWRDTVFVPPKGTVLIHQRFGGTSSFTGKTVFHCHFLDHEDLGMMQNLVIADPAPLDSDGPVSKQGSSESSKSGEESEVTASSSGIASKTCPIFLAALAMGFCDLPLGM